jgi:hypothetical protein
MTKVMKTIFLGFGKNLSKKPRKICGTAQKGIFISQLYKNWKEIVSIKWKA